MKIKIGVVGRYAEPALISLKSDPKFEVIHAKSAPSENLIDCEGLLIRSGTQINEDVLKRLTKLKVLATATSGFDHIDLSATLKKNIRVYFAPQGNAQSAAELTWALVLACARKLVRAHKVATSSEWDRSRLEGIELGGKTYGIIGLGRIGSRVAKIAKAFDMRVIAYDPYAQDANFQAVGVERVGLEEVLRISDVVSMHVPLTKETHHMLNAVTLELLDPETILVNTSRGPVIREGDLAMAIQTGDILHVGLDVFEKEPLTPKSALYNFRDQLVLSPHIGALTQEAFERSSKIAAEHVQNFFLNGMDSARSKEGLLPPEEPWYTASAAPR